MSRTVPAIGYIFLVVSALTTVALAGPKGSGLAKDNHDHHFDAPRRHCILTYWWYDGYGYQYAYDFGYWQNLAVKVQLELARCAFYHGPINGVIDSGCRQAIRAFQKVYGLPVTRFIDPGLLVSLKLPVPQASSRVS